MQEMFWRGKPVNDMLKEDLLEVIKTLQYMLEQEKANHNHTLDIWQHFIEVNKK